MIVRGWVKRLALLVAVGMFVGANTPPLEAQSARIGLIDLQRVVVESKRGQEFLAKLRAEREAQQEKIDAEDGKIRKMEADFEKQRSVLSENARKEREKDIRQKTLDLRRKVEDLNREFSERDRELRGRLIQEIAQVVATYGEENGFLLIMEVRAGGVMYGNAAADVTKEVIAAYDGKK